METQNRLKSLLGIGLVTMGMAVAYASSSDGCTGVTNCSCESGTDKKHCYFKNDLMYPVYCTVPGTKTCTSIGATIGSVEKRWYLTCQSDDVTSTETVENPPVERVCS
jgi:hypothetical protein